MPVPAPEIVDALVTNGDVIRWARLGRALPSRVQRRHGSNHTIGSLKKPASTAKPLWPPRILKSTACTCAQRLRGGYMMRELANG